MFPGLSTFRKHVKKTIFLGSPLLGNIAREQCLLSIIVLYCIARDFCYFKIPRFFERFLGFLKDFWGFFDELEIFKGFLKSFWNF